MAPSGTIRGGVGLGPWTCGRACLVWGHMIGVLHNRGHESGMRRAWSGREQDMIGACKGGMPHAVCTAAGAADTTAQEIRSDTVVH